jgi:hypothetical protein
MLRGRPIGSKVRQNMVEILHYAKQLHGYHIYSIYKQLFPQVTMRAIYYHLKKGVETKEFKIAETRKEKGNYSWGAEVERTYYTLGENANAVGLPIVKEHFDKEKT